MDGFVYLDEYAPELLTDAKYAGADNFLGRPVCGYDAPRVCCALPVAMALKRAERLLKPHALRLLIWDSYRPQRAVDDFLRWAADEADQCRKAWHYPRVDKCDLVRLGYIAARSGHSRGCAVDLTLATASGAPLDMGTGFDFMDERSHHGAAGITETAGANRALLRDMMATVGLLPIEEEWWHYFIDPEPYPGQYFDFPIVR